MRLTMKKIACLSFLAGTAMLATEAQETRAIEG